MSFAIRRASSKSRARSTATTGPKTSSCASRAVGATSATMVGATYQPPSGRSFGGAAAQHDPPLLRTQARVPDHLVELPLADDGGDVGVVDRRTDAEPRGGVDEALEHLVVDGVDQDQARHGGALLTVEAEAALHRRRHGHVEVGRLVDDQGVLAAELHEGLLQVALPRVHDRRALMDAHAGRDRTREVDEARARVVDQPVADLGVGAGDQVHDAVGPPRLGEALQEHAGDDRRLRRGLEDDRVARGDGPHRAADQDREQEVPRGDHQTDPDRLQGRDVLFARPRVGGQRLVEAQGGARVVLDEIDRLGDVGIGLAPVLARLEGLPGAELELAPAEHRGELVQGAGALGRGPARPDREGGLGGRVRAVDLGGARRCGVPDHAAGRARVHRREGALRRDPFAADDERPRRPQAPRDGLERGAVRVRVGGEGEVREGLGRVRRDGGGIRGHGGLLVLWVVVGGGQPNSPRSTTAAFAGRSARRRLK